LIKHRNYVWVMLAIMIWWAQISAATIAKVMQAIAKPVRLRRRSKRVGC
jgi:hypothetical protein